MRYSARMNASFAAANFDTPSPRFLKSRWVSVAEVVIVLAALVASQWIPWENIAHDVTWRRPLRTGLMALLVIVIVYSFVRRAERLEHMGLSPRQWRQGWGGMALYTLVSLIVLAGLGYWAGRPGLDIAWVGQYLGGLLGQQLALQCFLNNRIFYMGQDLPPTRRITLAVLLSTLAFALLHTPNWWLVALVIPSGLVWTLHFRLHRNLPAVLASHLILGTATMLLLGQGPLLRLRVGWPAWELMRGQ